MKTVFSKIDKKNFCGEIESKKISLYILKNKNGLEMSVTNFGARVVELFAPDRDGNFDDIVLGHNTLDQYVNFKAARFLGATVGRFANRIAGGKFKIGERQYSLELNNGKNALHGGVKGFDMKPWDVLSCDGQKIVFRLLSKDGDQGYPADLQVDMSFELTDADEFRIEYAAVSDAETVVNLTNHSFFNLHGEAVGDIDDHILTINADYFTPVDENLIPTGKLKSVANTPFDFRKPTEIGRRLGVDDEQLKRGNGYDHNWVLKKNPPFALQSAAVVFDPKSGREMEVLTTQPGLQFFGGGSFCGRENGKNGLLYNRAAAFALETQHFPDSPNRANFPTTLLKPNETYKHVCIYKFGAK